MNKFFPFFFIVLLAACGQSQPTDTQADQLPEMDRRTKIRFDQYKVQGMTLYTKHCSQCHQASGEGLASLYPPLKQADYLLEDLPRAACIIINGQVQAITVNGKTYNQMMPGVQNLTPLEVAEIMTYITNSWGNAKGLIEVKEVEKWLQACE
jgi:mono/diheme cytochrome c family protein